jgi:hypothetical protein
MRLVPNKPLREAFERSPRTAGEIALQLGYTKICKGREISDPSQVLRALGLKAHTSKGYRTTQTEVGEEKALKLAEALGLFPCDIDL